MIKCITGQKPAWYTEGPISVYHSVVLRVFHLRNHGGAEMFISGAIPLWETESKKTIWKTHFIFLFYLPYHCVTLALQTTLIFSTEALQRSNVPLSLL